MTTHYALPYILAYYHCTTTSSVTTQLLTTFITPHISISHTGIHTYSKEVLEVHSLCLYFLRNQSLFLKLVYNPLNGHDLSLIKGLSTTRHRLHAIGGELLQPLPQLVEGAFTAGREEEIDTEG